MSEGEPGKWRLRVFAGKDPVTGKRRQPERTFYGTLLSERGECKCWSKVNSNRWKQHVVRCH